MSDGLHREVGSGEESETQTERKGQVYGATGEEADMKRRMDSAMYQTAFVWERRKRNTL